MLDNDTQITELRKINAELQEIIAEMKNRLNHQDRLIECLQNIIEVTKPSQSAYKIAKQALSEVWR